MAFNDYAAPFLGGAASGAAAGAPFGPYGVGIGAGVGALAGLAQGYQGERERIRRKRMAGRMGALGALQARQMAYSRGLAGGAAVGASSQGYNQGMESYLGSQPQGDENERLLGSLFALAQLYAQMRQGGGGQFGGTPQGYAPGYGNFGGV